MAGSSSFVRTLGLFALVISLVPTILLIPTVMYPPAIIEEELNGPAAATLHFAAGFYPIKFQVLMALAPPLLVSVVAAVLADLRRAWVPLLWPALAYLGASTLSTVFAESPLDSLFGVRYDGLLYLIVAVLLFYAAARFLDSWARVRVFLAAGVVSGVLISVYGIIQQFGLDPVPGYFEVPWQQTQRAFGTLQHAVHLAVYLTLMMGATLALYFSTPRRWERGLWLAALAVVGACWLYTYTRGSMLGVGVTAAIILVLAYQRLGGVRPLLPPAGVLAAGMAVAYVASPVAPGLVDVFGSAKVVLAGVVMLLGVAAATAAPWFVYRRYGSIRPLVLTVVGVLAVGLVAAYILVPRPPTIENVMGIENVARTAEGERLDPRDQSIVTRLLTWRDTLVMISDRPILGYGPDNFSGAFDSYASPELRTYFPDIEIVDKAHNEFLQVTATTGLLGLAAYVWLLVAYFVAAYRSGGWTMLALSGGVLAYIIQLQTAFTTIGVGVTFWCLLGVSVAVMRLRKKHPEEAAEVEGSDRPLADPAAK